MDYEFRNTIFPILSFTDEYVYMYRKGSVVTIVSILFIAVFASNIQTCLVEVRSLMYHGIRVFMIQIF